MLFKRLECLRKEPIPLICLQVVVNCYLSASRPHYSTWRLDHRVKDGEQLMAEEDASLHSSRAEVWYLKDIEFGLIGSPKRKFKIVTQNFNGSVELISPILLRILTYAQAMFIYRDLYVIFVDICAFSLTRLQATSSFCEEISRFFPSTGRLCLMSCYPN